MLFPEIDKTNLPLLWAINTTVYIRLRGTRWTLKKEASNITKGHTLNSSNYLGHLQPNPIPLSSRSFQIFSPPMKLKPRERKRRKKSTQKKRLMFPSQPSSYQTNHKCIYKERETILTLSCKDDLDFSNPLRNSIIIFVQYVRLQSIITFCKIWWTFIAAFQLETSKCT